jgi:phosphatidylserine decarboxylase
MNLLSSVLVPIHREGYPFVAIFVAVTLLLFWIWPPLGWLGFVATCWCVYFFRDPDRVVPLDEGLLVSPADGRVLSVTQAAPPPELGMGDGQRQRIAIFMNVFNVHVNRVPADGVITGLDYRPGKFLNASLDKASEDNERQAVRMTTGSGHDIAFVQIAGLVARRIVCELFEGQQVRGGERFGIIRFGSRVDIYLDDGLRPLVSPGQMAVAGETVLAVVAGGDKRKGEMR